MRLSAVFWCACVVAIWVVRPPSAKAQEVEDERDFSYDAGRENGPERWGEIHAEWRLCGNGTLQSPIDMDHERVRVDSNLGRLRRSYRPANATMVNRGHDIMLRWEGDAGDIKMNGSLHKIRQCHWHSPSEHTISGRRFEMEMHMVHQNPETKEIAVVGIMYKIGRPDSFLCSLREDLMALSRSGERERAVGMVSPEEVQLGGREYYRYYGSLTTPPCTEGVTWTIVKKIRTASKEQLRLLREAVDDDAQQNARPLQLLRDRPLKMFRPRDQPRN